MSGDTNPAAFLPLALILHQTVFFDAFVGAGLGPNVAYAFPLVNGHFVSLFPIVTPDPDHAGVFRFLSALYRFSDPL